MPPSSNARDGLTVMNTFGTDPGSLSANICSKNFPKNGLVVVLHGSAVGGKLRHRFRRWSALADECGIALLFETRRI
jgi:poly(3-hydroxybutyrate) depolymerase